MSYIENFKIQDKHNRKKEVFLQTLEILKKTCNKSKKSFWLTQFYNCSISKHSFPEDIDRIIHSLDQNLNIDDENELKVKLSLLLETSLSYCKIPKAQVSCPYYNYCNCNEIQRDLVRSIEILLNGNDKIIFDAKIRIENKEGQSHPNIYLDPLEYVETIKITKESENIDDKLKELVSNYYKIGNDLNTKIAIASRLSSLIIEKLGKETLLENEKNEKIKLLILLRVVVNNLDFRHANDSKYSPYVKLTISVLRNIAIHELFATLWKNAINKC